MVTPSHPSQRPDDPRSQPNQQLEDHAGGQGEVVLLPLQFVVAPNHGRFHLASLTPSPNGPLTLARGTRIGEVRNGASTQTIHSPFGGHLDRWLVWDGQLVAPGQPLCRLRVAAGATQGR